MVSKSLKRSTTIFWKLAGGSVIAFIAFLLWKKKQKKQARKSLDQNNQRQGIAATIKQRLNEPKNRKWKPLEKLILAQASHETGKFTSKFFLNNKNLFGMGQPMIRPTKSIGKSGNHEGQCMAVFKSYADSIDDLLLWLEYNKLTPTSDPLTYAQRLKDKKYYSDTVQNYYTALKRHL